jgi:hypothetical protein
MKVKGRDKPTATVRTNDDGTVTFHIDFDRRPDAWAEIEMTSAELLALAHSRTPLTNDSLEIQ